MADAVDEVRKGKSEGRKKRGKEKARKGKSEGRKERGKERMSVIGIW